MNTTKTDENGQTITILGPVERWKAARQAHLNFIMATDLGPIQKNKAKQVYRDIHWEGATMSSGDGFVSRVLTNDPDEARANLAVELLDQAWASIGWKLTKKNFIDWYALASRIPDTMKRIRPVSKEAK